MISKTTMVASLMAVFIVSIISMAYADPRTDYLDITDVSTGASSTVTLAENVKEIPANKALGTITFWAFPVAESFGGGSLNVAAITIHHGVNDHQYVGSIDSDPKPVNQSVRSTPVQSFHPHYASFDGAGCLVGLVSPKIDFNVSKNTVSLDTSGVTPLGFAATGTIGPRPECTATGLGITNLDDFQ